KDPKPVWIQAAPGDFVLRGRWAVQRIVVTGSLPGGALVDLTERTQFKSANARIAAVSRTGLVTPQRDGETTIQVNTGGRRQKLHVIVQGSGEKLASFRQDVEPAFGKLGCNSAR